MPFCLSKGIVPVKLDSFRAIAGYGVEGSYQGRPVFLGQADWMLPKLPLQERQRIEPQVAEAKELGEAVAILLTGEKASVFRLKDHLRPGVRDTLQSLKNAEACILSC